LTNQESFWSDQSGLFFGLLEVDDGGGGSDAAAAAEAFRAVLFAVTRFAIQLHVVRSHVLQLQHFIAHIAFEASLVVLVVANHDLFCSIDRLAAFWAFRCLHRFERHL